MKINFSLSIIAFLIVYNSCKQKENPKDILFLNSFQEWFEDGNAQWELDQGVLIGSLDSGSGFVMTKDVHSNFEMTLEFFPDSTINSGVYLRCRDKVISATDCYEINIWDLHPNQENRTGAVVGRALPLQNVETTNKWNTYRIRIQKEHIEAWINGIQTVNYYNHDLVEGYIPLQAAVKGEIRFRNVQITDLMY